MNNIGVVGCGRLGICYAISFAKAGFKVNCYDINIEIITSLENDTYNYNETGLNELIKKYKHNLILHKKLELLIDNSKFIFSFIQTPSLDNGSYNHCYIENFIDFLSDYKIKNDKIILINSTVMPEFCNNIQERLNKISNNYKLIYNPSFIAQGSIINNITDPDFILLGYDNYQDINDNTLNNIIEIYNKIVNPNSSIIYNKMKLYEAEITKLSINCFVTTKISFANSIGDIIKSKGYNPDTVLRAIGCDSRIGYKCLNYGYGYGGPCLPRDNKALNYYSKNNNYELTNCISNDENNYKHLLFQFNELKNSKEPIEFHKITYKDNSDIIEQSQKLELAIMLANYKKKVIIYERTYIINILKTKYGNLFEYREI